jgi:prephenate dehydratase
VDYRTVLYVGPPGNSDQRAAELLAAYRQVDVDILPMESLDMVATTSDMTQGAFGVVTLEDNLHGVFTETIGHLVFRTGHSRIGQTMVLSELIHAQTLDASVSPQVAYSHPALLERFASILSALGIVAESVGTTRQACEIVKGRGSPLCIALAPDVVAQESGLVHHPALEQTSFEVHTKYGLLGRDWGEPDDDVQAMLVFLLPMEDRVGTLARIVEIVSCRDINMTSLRSISMGAGRPHGFLVEVIGRPQDHQVTAMLLDLVASSVAIKIIGAYNYVPLPGEDVAGADVPRLIRSSDELAAWYSGVPN